MTTQKKRVLAHLKAGNPIDPMTALRLFGILRLGARIYDLRADGHVIDMQLIEVDNRFGETCRIARYTMENSTK